MREGEDVNDNREDLAKELTDIPYVCYWTAAKIGIDVNKAFPPRPRLEHAKTARQVLKGRATTPPTLSDIVRHVPRHPRLIPRSSHYRKGYTRHEDTLPYRAACRVPARPPTSTPTSPPKAYRSSAPTTCASPTGTAFTAPSSRISTRRSTSSPSVPRCTGTGCGRGRMPCPRRPPQTLATPCRRDGL